MSPSAPMHKPRQFRPGPLVRPATGAGDRATEEDLIPRSVLEGRLEDIVDFLREKQKSLAPSDYVPLMDSLTQNSCWAASLELFQMTEEERAHSCDMWTAAARACSEGGAWELALQVLDDMQRSQLSPGPPLCELAMRACAGGGAWQQALHLFFEYLDPQELVQFGSNAKDSLVAGAAEAGEWEAALALLGSSSIQPVGIKPSALAHGYAVSALERGGELERAMEVFRTASADSISPNHMSLNAAIRATARQGGLEEARQLLAQAAAGTEGDLERETFLTALSAFDEAGDWEQVLELLAGMRTAKVRIEPEHYSAVFSAYVKSAQGSRALQVLGAMERANMPLDADLCVQGMRACDQSGEWQKALAVMGNMASRNIAFTPATYRAGIMAAGRSRHWQAALHFFHDSDVDGQEDAVQTFNAALHALYGTPAAQAIFDLAAAGDIYKSCCTSPTTLAVNGCSPGAALFVLRHWLSQQDRLASSEEIFVKEVEVAVGPEHDRELWQDSTGVTVEALLRSALKLWGVDHKMQEDGKLHLRFRVGGG